MDVIRQNCPNRPKYATMESRCRLCAEAKEPYQLECSVHDQQPNVRQMLLDCCRWATFEGSEYEHLPVNVCKSCFSHLKLSWYFANKVANAQQALLDLWTTTMAIKDEPHTDPLADDQMGAQLATIQMPPGPGIRHNIRQHLAKASTPKDSDGANGLRIAPVQSVDPHFDHWSDYGDASDESEHRTASAIEISADHFEMDPNFQLLKQLRKGDGNRDGTIKPEAVQRLRLLDWSFIKYPCYICGNSLSNVVQLKRHVQEKHPNESFAVTCVFCHKKQFSESTNRMKNHITEAHLPYLKLW